MGNYSGYLSEHEGYIRKLYADGVAPMEIAKKLFEKGVRTNTTSYREDGKHITVLYNMIGYILKLRKNQLPSIEKLESRVAWAKEQLSLAKEALAEAKKQNRKTITS